MAALLLAAASALAFIALRQTADMFYTPTSLAERGGPEIGKRIRIGGLVAHGTLVYGEGAELRFRVIDESGHIDVVHTGIPPDLFREGSGVVATGSFRADGLFTATKLLAKHDADYRPRELEDLNLPES